MLFAGCDLGSTTGKVVVLQVDGDDASLVDWVVEPAGFKPEETADRVFAIVMERNGIASIDAFSGVVATGYGRANVSFIRENVSEISCHARGARWINPAARTVIDVGGQDVKAISIGTNGKVIEFAMNDKCSAGTGKFFEVMANTLRCSVPELAALALESSAPLQISSQCSVFAESEVISRVNEGASREDVAAGIHDSIARRLFVMLQRVGIYPDVVLTGGCAKNEGLRRALERLMGEELDLLPCDPQIAGALGAAFFARDKWLKANGG
jgi:(R)-2-hydroxyacyl-CoA dehydratese activating ATPase